MSAERRRIIQAVGRLGRRVTAADVVHETGAMAGRQLGQTWNGIADALLGVISAKAVEFISDLVPGFREHYSEAGGGDQRSRQADRGRYETAYGG